MALSNKLFFGMIIGGIIGVFIGPSITVIKPLGDLFIRLLYMAAIPLVFFNLVAGLVSLKNSNALKSIGSRILVFYLATTAFAFFVGITLSRIIKLGVGFQFQGDVPSNEVAELPNFLNVLVGMVPRLVLLISSLLTMNPLIFQIRKWPNFYLPHP